MKQEADPITSDELLLRWIPNQQDYVNFSLPVPIVMTALRPMPRDIDGLSLFRQSVLQAHYGCDFADVVARFAAEGSKPNSRYVTRIKVGDIWAIDVKRLKSLSVTTLAIKPTPGPLPGHVVLSDFTRGWYEANRADGTALATELAKIASQDICFRP